jgi:acyl-coenzyme A thioesterase PaaI-like protein
VNESSIPRVTYDPAKEGWEEDHTGAFLTLVGPIWRKSEGKSTSYGFVGQPKHGNHRGIIHGGMIMSFADYAIGMAAAHEGANSSVTIQLDVQFVSAAEIGEFITSRQELVRKTTALFFMRGELIAGTRVVATASGIWKAVKPCFPSLGPAA